MSLCSGPGAQGEPQASGRGRCRQWAPPQMQGRWVGWWCGCLPHPVMAVKCIRLGRNVQGMNAVLRWLPLCANLSCASRRLLLNAHLVSHLVTRIILCECAREVRGCAQFVIVFLLLSRWWCWSPLTISECCEQCRLAGAPASPEEGQQAGQGAAPGSSSWGTWFDEFCGSHWFFYMIISAS